MQMMNACWMQWTVTYYRWRCVCVCAFVWMCLHWEETVLCKIHLTISCASLLIANWSLTDIGFRNNMVARLSYEIYSNIKAAVVVGSSKDLFVFHFPIFFLFMKNYLFSTYSFIHMHRSVYIIRGHGNRCRCIFRMPLAYSLDGSIFVDFCEAIIGYFWRFVCKRNGLCISSECGVCPTVWLTSCSGLVASAKNHLIGPLITLLLHILLYSMWSCARFLLRPLTDIWPACV